MRVVEPGPWADRRAACRCRGDGQRSRRAHAGRQGREGRWAACAVASRSYGSVAINVGNDVLVFNLNYDLDRNGVLASNGVTWQTSGPLIYASADCSGRAYVGFGNLGSRRPVAVFVQDGKWVAYVGDAGEPQQITAHSYLQAQGKCLATTAERKVVPVTDRLQLDAYGMPPFYVQ